MSLGFDASGFIAGLGVMGFIVGFAVKDVLSNFAAGLFLLVKRLLDHPTPGFSLLCSTAQPVSESLAAPRQPHQ